MGPKICRASLIIGEIAYNYMEPSQNLLQIVFSKYGSTLVPRRERGYSQFSCYIDSALASAGKKKYQAYQIYKENVWKLNMPQKIFPGHSVPPETTKKVLWQTVTTQIGKCHMMVTFHQGLHSLLKQIYRQGRNTTFFGKYNLWPLNLYKGPSWLKYFKLYGKFHWSLIKS